jgi:hypothetical protein
VLGIVFFFFFIVLLLLRICVALSCIEDNYCTVPILVCRHHARIL